MSVMSPPATTDPLVALMALPVVRFFGFELVERGAGAITLAVDNRPELGHAPGAFQGTVTTAIAQLAAGFSASTAIPGGPPLMALDHVVKFVAPAVGGRLIARGRMIKVGRIMIAAADVFVVREGAETLCATGLATLSAISAKA